MTKILSSFRWNIWTYKYYGFIHQECGKQVRVSTFTEGGMIKWAFLQWGIQGVGTYWRTQW